MLSLRHYRGGVSFVPAPGFEDYGEQTRYDNETDSIVDVGSLGEGEPINIQRHGYQGPNINLKELNWRKIDGPFISVWLHNVPWGAENTLAAPDAKVCLFYKDNNMIEPSNLIYCAWLPASCYYLRNIILLLHDSAYLRNGVRKFLSYIKQNHRNVQNLSKKGLSTIIQ